MKRYLAVLVAWLVSGALAYAQVATPYHVLSTSSDNAQMLVVGSRQLNVIIAINTTTTLYYLKFYDTATTPLCGSTPVKWSTPVPFGASNAGGGLAPPLPPEGVRFQNGIGICLTGGIADTDDSSAAVGVALNFGIK